uniref:Uncharacterized protein n=1 Tax=Cryptomonas curvata TaxID=233186 RepID=A0A7S0QHE0_9CRYP
MPDTGPLASDMNKSCEFQQSTQYVEGQSNYYFPDCPLLWLCFVLSLSICFPLVSVTSVYVLFKFLSLDSIISSDFYKPCVEIFHESSSFNGNPQRLITIGEVTDFLSDGTVEINGSDIRSKDQFRWNFTVHPEVHAKACTW